MLLSNHYAVILALSSFFMQSSNVRVSHKHMVRAGIIRDAFDVSNWPGRHLQNVLRGK